MAIEISSQKGRRAPLIITIIGILIIVLILASLGSYLYFYLSNRGFVKKIQDLDESATQLNKTIGEEETKLSEIQKKIDDYSFLMSGHKNILNVFDFIEKNTIPIIWFNDFDVEIKENSISLTGISPSYILVEQQVNVFKKQALVKEVELLSLSKDEEGKIGFSIKIAFDSGIFFLASIEN